MHHHINKDDRACIAALLRKGYTYSDIADVVGVHYTTIGREIRRNSTESGVYDTRRAQRQATLRRVESKQVYRIIDTTSALKQCIIVHLKKDWSPQQTSNRLGVSSTSSIYRFIDRHSHLKQYLRRHGKKRRRYGTKRILNRYQANKRSIHERPAVTTIGHWEGDTIVGKERKWSILTHVDKISGYLIADFIRHSSNVVYEKVCIGMRYIPCESITYDNGSEFALHRMIERSTGALVYFADAGKPHQRGSNENTNGLLRQYFPKGSSFATITNNDVQRAVRKLNSRPRKRLNYLTPREFLEKEGVHFR